MVRKEVVIIDEIRAEIGKPLPVPLRKCASVAIVENLFAGKRVEDLSLYGEYGEWLGRLLVENALEALGVGPEEIQSYGKAVVTGLAGEQEHGSALLHIAFDGPVREALRDTLSIIPSTEKAGPAAARSTCRCTASGPSRCGPTTTRWRSPSRTAQGPMKSWWCSA